jgi:uncharacterized protein (DUF885 family)
MLNRRDLLLTAAASALTSALPTTVRPAAAAPKPVDLTEAARMNALFDSFVQASLQRQPEEATSLGLDTGALAPLKSKLTDASLAAVAKEKTDNAKHLAELKAIDRSKLSPFDQASYDTVMFTLAIEDEANRAFDYGGNGAGAPYVLSQLTGSYQSTPDFLDTQHTIETKEDADAYLARMDAFATMMDQEMEQVRHDVGLGVTPPDFVIDKMLMQMDEFLKTPAEKATIVQSLVRRAAAHDLPGDYGQHAGTIYTTKILPALGRQAAFFKDARPKAVHEAGVARLPQGGEYYRVSLKQYTTSAITPDEVHQTGLDLVASLTAEIDGLLKAQNLTRGSVGARLAAMTADPKYLYENTDAAKDKLIGDLNAKVVVVQGKLPQFFGTLPKAKVEIRRVPKAIEAGAPGGYYQPGSLDGSRPGAYYINLRDTAELPNWTLPSLTYHEAIPGHHLQLTLANEMKDLPLIRKMIWFSGYGEGWALYAEQLAVEMGMYANDPMGHVGQLHDAMLRAVRLVVDSGMHAKGWSREKAVGYYVDALGDKESSAITEVERYCVWPGQACSYMVGKLTWLKARERARQALGDKYDIRQFHDAGLLSGALPLAVLETVIDDYVAKAKA